MTALDDVAAVAFLERAVATPSVSGSEDEVARLFVDAMRACADRSWIDDAGNAVGVVGDGPVRVTILGHIDTVPGVIRVRREGDRLYGRGAVDAKGPFCTAVAAASRLAPATRERLTLTLVGAVEEEVPSSRGARHAVASLPAPDLVVIGEPSGWDSLTLGYKGRLVARATARVDHAHSASDRPTAAEQVVSAWGSAQRWAEEASTEAEGIFDAVQATLQDVHSATDGLEQTASATIGFRLPPAWPPERVRAELAALAVPAGVRFEFTGSEEPYRGPRDTPLTRAFRVAIRAEGARPRTNVKTGTSDMNVVAPVWNVPMLAYGPGDSTLDHTPDEHVMVPEYLAAVRVLSTALDTLAEQTAGLSRYSPDKS